jgi:hypothetical protein
MSLDGTKPAFMAQQCRALLFREQPRGKRGFAGIQWPVVTYQEVRALSRNSPSATRKFARQWGAGPPSSSQVELLSSTE